MTRLQRRLIISFSPTVGLRGSGSGRSLNISYGILYIYDISSTTFENGLPSKRHFTFYIQLKYVNYGTRVLLVCVRQT